MNGIDAVQYIQNYIKAHISENDFDINSLCQSIGYSRRHADRLFKKYIGMTLHGYISEILLTQGANELLSTNSTVLNIALNSHFQSHEGFTRSFEKKFNISPQSYREKQIAIPMFTQYPIKNYYALISKKEDFTVKKDISLCMIIPQIRSKRKLIYHQSKNASDYLTFCEEFGCEWEGLLNSIPEKLDTAAILELPQSFVQDGLSSTACGVEVPLDYCKELPDGYKTAVLEPCTMLCFQSEPYENEEDFTVALDCVFKALEKYCPSQYGYEFAKDTAPSFNFGADRQTGARIAVPVRKI